MDSPSDLQPRLGLRHWLHAWLHAYKAAEYLSYTVKFIIFSTFKQGFPFMFVDLISDKIAMDMRLTK